MKTTLTIKHVILVHPRISLALKNNYWIYSTTENEQEIIWKSGISRLFKGLSIGSGDQLLKDSGG